MEIQEISEKHSIDVNTLRFVKADLTFANNVDKKLGNETYKQKDQTKEINKIVNAAPWASLVNDSENYNPDYQIFLKSYHQKWPHPIEKITFKLKGSETVVISDEIVIELIRQGLKNYLTQLPKPEKTAAHRPKLKQRMFLKRAVNKLLKVAPDGSQNSKYIFVADILVDFGYLKTEDQFNDFDVKDYDSHHDYKLSNVKNALK